MNKSNVKIIGEERVMKMSNNKILTYDGDIYDVHSFDVYRKEYEVKSYNHKKIDLTNIENPLDIDLK